MRAGAQAAWPPGSRSSVDPKTATPAEIVRIRKIQTGYQVDGITGGLGEKKKS
jgi:hypothetical protein